MNETQLAGRAMLKVTGIVLIILSALGLLGGLALIGAGLAMGTDDGLGWGLATAVIVLGVLAIPTSIYSLVTGILGVKWCARPDKARVLFVLGVVFIVLAALNLLASFGDGNISATAGAAVRLVLAAFYTLGAWRNRQAPQ